MNKRGIEHMHAIRVNGETLAPLLAYEEETEDIVVIKKTHYRRATFRGVPARRLDLVIEGGVELGESGWFEVLLHQKQGRYDGAVRYRIQVRRDRQVPEILYGNLVVSHMDDGTVEIILRDGVSAGVGIKAPLLRSDLDTYRLGCVWMWHFRRYYLHLHDEIENAVDLGDAWAASVEDQRSSWTLAEANRSASRDLYRISRELGWRKLTAREQEKHGVDTMWIRISDLEKRMSATGCGEYTLEAARSQS